MVSNTLFKVLSLLVVNLLYMVNASDVLAGGQVQVKCTCKVR